MKHELKCWPQYFENLYVKPFEVRKNDRGYQLGDSLHLREWDPGTKEYTGRECLREVIYILHEHEGLVPGFVCMALGPWKGVGR